MNRNLHNIQFWLLLLCVFFANIFVHGLFYEANYNLHLELDTTQPTSVDVYWDCGESFKEENRKHYILNKSGHNYVDEELSCPLTMSAVRLDILPKTEMGIREITLNPREVKINLLSSNPDQLIAHDLDRLIRSSSGLELSGGDKDPYLVFTVKSKVILAALIGLVNIGIVGVIILLFKLLLNYQKITPQINLVSALIVLVGIGLICLITSFTQLQLKQSNQAFKFPFVGIMISLSYFALSVRLSGNREINVGTIIMLILIPLVSVSVIVDSFYHFGYFNNPVFSHYIPPYHWKLNLSQKQNYQNTSFRYIEDIKEIKKLSQPKSVFYSDIATSYYITASTQLYAANPHAHHKISIKNKTATAPDSLITSLCQGAIYVARYETLREYFDNKNQLNVKNGWSPISYFIYNRDVLNHNILNCSEKQTVSISLQLENEFDLLFKGEYLDLYRIVE